MDLESKVPDVGSLDVEQRLKDSLEEARIDLPVKRKVKQKVHRLVLPENFIVHIQPFADQQDITVNELIRQWLKMDIILAEQGMVPGTTICIVPPGKPEKRILFL